ncbi:MAG TPA: GMC family oxidoreductase [Dongiaceae bacterium]|nr:GMC family oxidoreductase [Dongiaceae bacterium]
MKYDLIVVGTSFAASFFLHRLLQQTSKPIQVLVLERGPLIPHAEQVERRRLPEAIKRHLVFDPVKHRWVTNVMFGGNSNCWFGCTPRMLPTDFKLRQTYGVGYDWPLDYTTLEPYYEMVETIMSVSGPEQTPFPRRTPYPEPPHQLNDFDKAIQRQFPDAFFVMPTARARISRVRPACCGSGVCSICPIDSKFTVMNGFRTLYQDPRITLKLNSQVLRVKLDGERATGLYALIDGREEFFEADAIALGANAIYNPQILLKSGDTSPMTGKGINEQISFTVDIFLDGLNNYQGSTSLTGHGYMFYDGAHRKERAACMVETSNIALLRPEMGRWTQRAKVKFIFEDIPLEKNHISITTEDGVEKASVNYHGHSDYTQRGIDYARTHGVQELLQHLPVERVIINEINKTEYHALGSIRMGDDPATSVVDRNLVHHRYRNLLCLGSGTFPSCAPANPTLTLSALSLRAADFFAKEAL